MKRLHDALNRMLSGDKQRNLQARYLEVNTEHVAEFLQALNREIEVDALRVQQLIRDTLAAGASLGEIGLPSMRCAGRWSDNTN